jgi:PPOX class probable F420-dependent enzyme
MDETVRRFLDEQPVGVLATSRKGGSVRQSVVYHALDGDRVLISTESQRAKTRDVERTGRASYCLFAHEEPFASVTVEGPARIVRDGAGAMTTRLFEKVSGAAMPEPLTDEQCADMNRVILELTVERIYGVSHLK